MTFTLKRLKRLRQLAPKVEIVSHLINGLPGETHDMMIENVRRCVTDNEIDGIKLHLLHLMTSTKMQRDYHEGRLNCWVWKNMLISSVTNWRLFLKISLFIVLQVTLRAICSLVQCGVLKKWEVLNAIDQEMGTPWFLSRV